MKVPPSLFVLLLLIAGSTKALARDLQQTGNDVVAAEALLADSGICSYILLLLLSPAFCQPAAARCASLLHHTHQSLTLVGAISHCPMCPMCPTLAAEPLAAAAFVPEGESVNLFSWQSRAKLCAYCFTYSCIKEHADDPVPACNDSSLKTTQVTKPPLSNTAIAGAAGAAAAAAETALPNAASAASLAVESAAATVLPQQGETRA